MIDRTGAILVAQWIDPYGSASASFINQQLDEIAAAVATEILERTVDGAESCCLNDLTVNAVLDRVRMLNLPRDVILEAINDVLYTKLGFAPANGDEGHRLDSSLIDKVTQAEEELLVSPLHCTCVLCELILPSEGLFGL